MKLFHSLADVARKFSLKPHLHEHRKADIQQVCMITMNNRIKEIVQIKALTWPRHNIYKSCSVVVLWSGGMCDSQKANRKYVSL